MEIEQQEQKNEQEIQYFNQLPLSERIKQRDQLFQNKEYADLLPVIVELEKPKFQGDISNDNQKIKYLAQKEIKLGQFLENLDNQSQHRKAIYNFINEENINDTNQNVTMEQVYNDKKNPEDNFLYIFQSYNKDYYKKDDQKEKKK
ncbi:hypothetical protein PPERSA_09028 [Pseudocohnilembus persalinus]|uniref:Uncharacterized protein n=1 Tax=Pseudocohnilembus persalinus TaxID=266149 RepID=A0A0V0R332_PSEPJ|nr:hypothetical protein PPERSA_09028 [Pseudocohnilembus persalinus]|eukprot:KRX08924.1 hypothetical protein PPERSA_09028 [Pseudocohnilembus persalinus]